MVIRREMSRSNFSSLYEVQLFGKRCIMKLFHDNGDPGYTRTGRDLDRFRCGLRAYQKFHELGVCYRGFVPIFYGYIDRLDPAAFDPPLHNFRKDKFMPRAIFIEYLSDSERLNCLNYSQDLINQAVQGLKEIHNAFVHHRDIYPKHMLVMPEGRIVWVDFDVATIYDTVGPIEDAYREYETQLVESFGKLLADDQRQGLPPNTKYY
ncbi:hypothetical protein N7478_010698 [Penicillium angulare]|uniref:uncharacterized protein n=1 Tax=Penicillium angulare TaxID=116970 RepID=UPI002541C518|nr:uncharacterized protein N7478_010698 [Penicillium angulare]KAJ5267890.1 hypothetical protein N7478_010698 [Penicillium angulare]